MTLFEYDIPHAHTQTQTHACMHPYSPKSDEKADKVTCSQLHIHTIKRVVCFKMLCDLLSNGCVRDGNGVGNDDDDIGSGISEKSSVSGAGTCKLAVVLILFMNSPPLFLSLSLLCSCPFLNGWLLSAAMFSVTIRTNEIQFC